MSLAHARSSFEQLLPGGGVHTDITLTMTADKASANSCGASDAELPSSLSTGGFAKFWASSMRDRWRPSQLGIPSGTQRVAHAHRVQ